MTFNFKNTYTGEDMKARLVVNRYTAGDRLYVGLETMCEEDGCTFWEPWADITVNIPDAPLSFDDCAFIDVNNFPEAEKFLAENGIAFPTYGLAFSGLCQYPEYMFDMERVKELAA